MHQTQSLCTQRPHELLLRCLPGHNILLANNKHNSRFSVRNRPSDLLKLRCTPSSNSD